MKTKKNQLVWFENRFGCRSRCHNPDAFLAVTRYQFSVCGREQNPHQSQGSNHTRQTVTVNRADTPYILPFLACFYSINETNCGLCPRPRMERSHAIRRSCRPDRWLRTRGASLSIPAHLFRGQTAYPFQARDAFLNAGRVKVSLRGHSALAFRRDCRCDAAAPHANCRR